MELRPYQKDAVEAAINWIKSCVDPCVIEAPTGAGKSHVIAAIAHWINSHSGKRILCLAPSGELVEQNYKKYLALGEPASIFSASRGRKETIHPVVFGSPLTVANNLLRFDSRYAAVVLDEAHGITPTVTKIIDSMRAANKNLRIIGLSATPYRMGSGYIYGNHFEYGKVAEDKTTDPFFHSLIYSIDARQLVDAGYLAPPHMEQGDEHYDTSGLVMRPTGKWKQSTIDRAFEGRGRKTSGIVADIVERSRNRNGVLIFAATINHAQEIMESLPPELSRIVTGSTKKAEREQILKLFLRRRIKYLVNVAVLTTGFDAPHVDVVAIMRATESAGLLTQIIGRGLRLSEGKTDCLILDYAENIERHFQNGDVFDPDIKARIKSESEPMIVVCPECNHENEFGRRKNEDNYQIDRYGYYIDPLGQQVMAGSGQPLPAHYGRRCQGERLVGGHWLQCSCKWSHKECPECGHDNDIAARYCIKCRAEIVDPNEKLKEVATKIAKDPYRTRYAKVTGWDLRRWPGKGGNPDTARVDISIDQSPHKIIAWFAPESSSNWARSKWAGFCRGRWGEEINSIDDAIAKKEDAKPMTEIAYRKNKSSKFFEVSAIK